MRRVLKKLEPWSNIDNNTGLIPLWPQALLKVCLIFRRRNITNLYICKHNQLGRNLISSLSIKMRSFRRTPEKSYI